MSKCKVNSTGLHAFYPTIAHDVRVGDIEEYVVRTWHTCIACGERRAITVWGELIQKVKGRWKIIGEQS